MVFFRWRKIFLTSLDMGALCPAGKAGWWPAPLPLWLGVTLGGELLQNSFKFICMLLKVFRTRLSRTHRLDLDTQTHQTVCDCLTDELLITVAKFHCTSP